MGECRRSDQRRRQRRRRQRRNACTNRIESNQESDERYSLQQRTRTGCAQRTRTRTRIRRQKSVRSRACYSHSRAGLQRRTRQRQLCPSRTEGVVGGGVQLDAGQTTDEQGSKKRRGVSDTGRRHGALWRGMGAARRTHARTRGQKIHDKYSEELKGCPTAVCFP